MSAHHYWFDRWAEYLTVTLAENCSRCELGLNKIEKIRISLTQDALWPTSFKVIMDNGIIASLTKFSPANWDGSHPIQYIYKSPAQIPTSTHPLDDIARDFIKKAHMLDPDFYYQAWSFNQQDSVAHLLWSLSLRSVARIIHKQLIYQGIELSDNFNLQFFDGSNYQSFNYNEITHSLRMQSALYFKDKRILKLLAELCFKHPENRKWFESLMSEVAS